MLRGGDLRFILEVNNRDLTEEEILEDILDVARRLGRRSLTQKDYVDNGGRLHPVTVFRRLGRWNDVLRSAGLEPAREVNLSMGDLFDNIRNVWMLVGRQPRRREIDSPMSMYSSRPYVKRFGSWRGTLEAFVASVNEDAATPSSVSISAAQSSTPRFPSLRLRFTVMRRDGFRCVQCGRSPATQAGVELHVDHVHPWSKGGLTVLENLQTLCADCNLGKSNL